MSVSALFFSAAVALSLHYTSRVHYIYYIVFVSLCFVYLFSRLHVYLYNKSNNSEELLLIGKNYLEILSYLLDQIIQRIVVIDTTGCNVCHCIVQTTHRAFLSCGIVLCYSCLPISLLSCLPLFCKGTTFFLRYANF